jgi:hypothetical protein
MFQTLLVPLDGSGFAEAALPLAARWAKESHLMPFIFGGGGAVTIHEEGLLGSVSNFTKPSAMFGLGFRYQIPRSPIELLMEGKSLGYKWEASGFSRTQWDLTYSAGLAYRFGL